MDRSDVEALERALDALEELHDFQGAQVGSGPVRRCLCSEAAAYRRARQVTDMLRAQAGMKRRID